MNYYLDTSLIISAFTVENATKRARTWLDATAGDIKFASRWVEVEIAAAVSMKAREQKFSTSQRLMLTEALKEFVRSSLTSVEVGDRHFREAERLAAAASGLRAGDALHLAVAAERGARVCTLDGGMARAAAELGIGCTLL